MNPRAVNALRRKRLQLIPPVAVAAASGCLGSKPVEQIEFAAESQRRTKLGPKSLIPLGRAGKMTATLLVVAPRRARPDEAAALYSAAVAVTGA